MCLIENTALWCAIKGSMRVHLSSAKMEGVREVRMRGGAQKGEEGGRGRALSRGRGRKGPEER